MLLGPAAYWPAKPPSPEGRAGGVWHRVAALVDRAPRTVWAVSLAGLLACAAFAPTLTSRGVPLDTLVVRSLLVPALALDLGRVAWWPGVAGRAAAKTGADGARGSGPRS